MKKNHLLLVLAIFILTDSQAQLLKGIKEKVASKIAGLDKKDSVKSTPQNSAATNQAEDDEKNSAKFGSKMLGMGMMTGDPSILPDAYTFSHIYQLRTQFGGENIDMDYYLTKTGKFFGSSLKGKEGVSMTMVSDIEKNIVVNYMEGQPFVMKMPKSKELPEENKDIDFKITDLPNKTFLGFNCKGKQLEDDLSVITVYVAQDLGIGMFNPFENQGAMPNKSIKLRNIRYDPGLIMYMMITDKKSKNDKKDTITMECISFQEKQTVLKNR